ncbi:HIT family protein [Methylobacillus arboreus]|uniref:HIT family protein n=1 Tax=Methylobacillus arboreus TaxID=755170 RepID=UPI001E3AFD3B|nr:HIT family protein [Methylobacillus arboreus]MCB5190729.1 HIT family protein [Methylobacillus arboreus]
MTRTMPYHKTCELCTTAGGEILWQDALCRVVHVEDQDYPGFCRVILNRHIKEMSDLKPADREHVMLVVFAVEEAVREVIRPDKVNLASLGNMTPHVHWHVIPRFKRDRHFPNPIWGASKRESLPQALDSGSSQALKNAIAARLNQGEQVFMGI